MDDLADVIYEGLHDIKADIGDTENEDLSEKDSLHGAKSVLIHRTHEIMCRGLEADERPGFSGVEKQCWNVFARSKTEAVDLAIADAMLLACGRMLLTEDLPVFPHSKESALEMVSVHFDLQGESVDSLTMERLAYKLYNFTQGFLNGPLAFQDELAVMRETQRDVERDRKKRERQLRKPTARRERSTKKAAVRVAAKRAEDESKQDFPKTGIDIIDKLAVDRYRRSREFKTRGGFVSR